MATISLENLKPGTFIERHLYFQKNFIVFPKYLALSAGDLERAQRFSLESLIYDERENPASAVLKVDEGEEIDGEAAAGEEGNRGSAPQVPEGEALAEKEIAQEVITGPEKEITIYGSIVALLFKEFLKVRQGEKIESARIVKIASIVIEYVSNVREEALLHVARGREKFRVEVHAVNVGILTSVLGSSLKLKGHDLIKIVTGAILHDVGILLIQEKLSADSSNFEVIKEHTTQGFRYLKSIKNLDPESVMPALQHHEKAGGDGYPQKLLLTDIEPASRLVGLCDSFDNQISFIKYGNDSSIHFTKDEFLAWKKEDFDPDLFTAFIRTMSEIFKYYAPVILNDGSLALVKEVSIRFPFAPVVQVIADENGNKISEVKVVDMRKAKELWISRFLKRAP